MRVLLITSDLYREIGGGQTVYKRLIQSAPNIEFVYFRDREPPDAQRPPNATAVSLSVRLQLKVLSAPPYPDYRRQQLRDADRYARSVAGQHFDVVDIPDYYSFGSLLRDAFHHHGVTVDRVVLAMHGNISVSLEMGWGSAGDNVLEQRMLERDQFEAADGVYAISPRYIREWRAIVERPVQFIDPICFVEVPDKPPGPTQQAPTAPTLYCIGRTERRKGNDLFVELVRWLDPSLYAGAAHIGDEMIAPWGVGTKHILWDIAKKRGLSIDYIPSRTRQELSQLFQARSVVVLPVRYDTLNLVALEALFEGCPVAISSEAGVCDYLDEHHPGLPYVKIDFGNFYEASERIGDLLRNYDHHRKQLTDYLAAVIPGLNKIPDIGRVYRSILAEPSTAVARRSAPVRYFESGQTLPARIVRAGQRLLPLDTYRKLTQVARSPKAFFLRKLRESEYFGDAHYLSVVGDAGRIPSRLKRVAEHSEYNRTRLREKLNELYAASSNPLYRCNFWLDIARIERILGNDLVAVTYELRALRLVGRDAFGLLPRVVATLRQRGFPNEADAAQALYDDEGHAEENVLRFLQRRYEANLLKTELPYEVLDDRRSGVPRVAIIVSMYNAASKLNVFLTTIRQQSLARSGGVEFIFIDSGSPTNEHAVLTEFWTTRPMNAVYARSQQRETIQAAWNRGIKLARAPYLVFLGVDETLYPEALETLARTLDEEPEVDWVMANSLVTAVDEHGVYKNDVMPYDRAGATKDHTYLETCYLSWVGGMYRQSVHERFGYYDESFGAAGDTEFKNRILPHINVKFLPVTLGLFLNYPDERTTASPRAEIEDLRAWYVHRSLGGVRYAFGNRSTQEVENLLACALGYRKSYCQHISSDIEYGTYLASLLASRDSGYTELAASLISLLDDLRRLEFTDAPPTQWDCVRALTSTWRHAKKGEQEHRTTFSDKAKPVYKILNDNRHEQHSWLWRT